MTPDHPNVARVVAYAKERGVDIAVRRFSGTTRTADDAAREIGTEVKRIVKSLVFMLKSKPVVVLCSGDNRVSFVRLEEIFHTKDVRRATAEEAKAHTGYAIGGVPPFAYPGKIDLVLDEDLHRFDTVWAAAGLPDAVFEISVHDLERLTVAASTGARFWSTAIAAIPGTQWER